MQLKKKKKSQSQQFQKGVNGIELLISITTISGNTFSLNDCFPLLCLFKYISCYLPLEYIKPISHLD